MLHDTLEISASEGTKVSMHAFRALLSLIT